MAACLFCFVKISSIQGSERPGRVILAAKGVILRAEETHKMSAPSVQNNFAPLDILVVGGGIAGIVLAVLLERKGHTVTIIEKSSEWKPVGGGITLTLNGVKVLEKLDLAKEIELRANQINKINIVNQGGKILSSFCLDAYTEEYARTFTILRSDLHKLLEGHLQKTQIHLKTNFTSIENVGEKVRVVWSNGVTKYYDLVAGCDGINSAVRRHLFNIHENKYAGYAAWRFLVHDFQVKEAGTITELWGNGKRFGIVPLRNNTVHCFASANTDKANELYGTIGLDEFREMFGGFGSEVLRLTSAIKSTDDLMYNDLEDVHLDSWYKGRVVLTGDAAHGMTPNMAQGASMAIEDAYVLAERLSDAASVERDILRYFEARRGRVEAVQRKSNLMGRIGQLNNPVLCGLRNFCCRQLPDKHIQNDLRNLLVSNVL
jgi:2-polyprenyl-6-methoxyphenol hydroxylase-like FAD-dependent oxidoreductase